MESKPSSPKEAEEVEEDSKRRTVLSLSLSVKDKKILKKLSMEKEKTIASIIHQLIEKADYQRKRRWQKKKLLPTYLYPECWRNAGLLTIPKAATSNR